jgi:hypothetical protein
MAGGDRLHTPMSDDQYHIKKKIQQLLMLARVLPVCHWDPAEANHHPHPVRRWRLANMAGALPPWALAVVAVSSHLMQGDGASFKIRGEEGCYRFDSLKIEMAG